MTVSLLDALRRGDCAGARELRFPPGLTEFPREIFGLADTLELLDFSGSALSTLPDDLGRLRRLRVLFCSGTRFTRLPPVLGDCPALAQVGFRACGLAEVPGEALPPALRWLTLTDNRIATLPDAIGERPRLQKLMLSGNHLARLPQSLAGAPNLELIRLAANRLEALPAWLPTLPGLAWTSFAGNPFEGAPTLPDVPPVPWADLEAGALLGEGTSGRVHRALWRKGGGAPEAVALKLFKGTMTSDGLPEREMAACLAAGTHPNLTGALGRIAAHPQGAEGLVMPLLPPDWRVLAGPPSLASCSRDVYDPALTLAPETALRIADGAARACAHLHARGILHGDLYGHNILWDGTRGAAVVSDFGAASSLPGGPDGDALRRVEVRSWGLLLGELLTLAGVAAGPLRDLERACIQADVAGRPDFSQILPILADAWTA
ncbi:leucine-rich repeat-containing protein kinase family protein [Methylobacterium sp. J-068]|uniref:leucine-rich repeat-containing protein kinase family protein n=1 Tax=Methylobacterium sp. J-068 TaxID=2836649 RepID=UPI001FB946B1|nr:leucine-rich repeat-containing protein kinase family protein [Methylobacterium sp. J-068]MCJ2035666.1 leucine-rich repeat-containing serine/threonine-protein kinase [Methylobacterium sp. J-068]